MTGVWQELADSLPRQYWIIWICAAVALSFAVCSFYSRSYGRDMLRQPPGSRIALAVDETFTPSERFAGFVHEASGTSLILTDLPLVAFEQFSKLGNAAERLKAQGVSGISQHLLPSRGGDYIYFRGEQTTSLVDCAKYILIFRDAGATGMVTANIPVAALSSGVVTEPQIETILASATIRPKAAEGKPLFSMSYSGPFEEDLSLLGTTKGYRLRGAEKAHASGGRGSQPLFLVAPSLARVPVEDIGAFSRRAFDGIEQFRDKQLLETSEMKIAGLDAVEAIGRGINGGTGRPTLLFQVVVAARKGGYFRLLGMAPDDAREEFLPEFRKMARGFRPLN
ncbi:hypothetical protein JDN40_04860 [Rhodomicrobium vannielii ATCC 17100]|uniref:hypothetical protein n=1 Tax=Rhodomicrobium vannielii TaxID=1069 RepID=UPI001919A18A|nr:hypothetical protein [Rhodomicrobium vannielii]MBJ7533435.1 hypothetical protein [Rhodomicrobium vannielii ATCC 17100]